MRTLFIILTSVFGLLIGFVYPFISVLRGRVVVKAVVVSWVASFLWLVFFCILLPMFVTLFSQDFQREYSAHWVPEATGVAAILVAGWVPPLIASVLALIFCACAGRSKGLSLHDCGARQARLVLERPHGTNERTIHDLD